jgi:hypothetical protein
VPIRSPEPVQRAAAEIAVLDQAEVRELGPAIVGQENVCRLDVAMDETGLVGSGQSAANIGDDGGGPLPGKSAIRLQNSQSAAPADQFHDQEVGIVVLGDIEDFHQVGMIELGGRPRFPEKTLQDSRIAGHAFGNQFQGHSPWHYEILGFINHPHAAFAEPAQDAISAQRGSNPWIRSGVGLVNSEGAINRIRGWFLKLHDGNSLGNLSFFVAEFARIQVAQPEFLRIQLQIWSLASILKIISFF